MNLSTPSAKPPLPHGIRLNFRHCYSLKLCQRVYLARWQRNASSTAGCPNNSDILSLDKL
jgi:hypothetical protein